MTAVIRAGEPTDLAQVRAALVDAFERVQSAIGDEQPVVVVVPAADLLGHRGPERGAYVGGLVGMVRAVAFEGARPGWSINALALPDGVEVPDGDVSSYVGAGVTGQVVTVGAGLIGKVAP
jgi:hypothetical protein